MPAALKRAVGLQPAAIDRSFQLVIDGELAWQSHRLTEARFGSAQRGLVPVRECEWDKGGGFIKIGPDDSQIRLPRSLCLSISCGHIPGFAAPARGKQR